MEFLNKNIRRLKFYRALAKANSYYTLDSGISFIPDTKHVCFELKEVDYHRYLYALVLFYQRAGYTVVIKASITSIARIMLDKYAQKLLDNSNVFFVNAFSEQLVSSLSIIQLNAAYFENDSSDFHIPMCQHPSMYDLQIDELQFDTQRVNSLGFAGDFRARLYGSTNLERFEHINRIAMLEALKKQTDRLIHLESNQSIPLEDHGIYIADNARVRFEPKAYREFISRFNFFLALPGIHMPISHNIIEAMSLGTIPFVHQSYAKHMYPPLEHMKTAFIFDDFNFMNNSIDALFSVNQTMVENMRTEVQKYYQKYLTPSAVIRNIEANNGSEIKLLAEWNSVNLNSKTS